MILTQDLTVALVVTIGFLVLGSLSKALVRSGWSWLDDLNLGVEAMLTTLSGAAVYGFELLKRAKDIGFQKPGFADIYELQQKNYGWLLTSVIALFAIATVHMMWERDTTKPFRRFLMLTIGANSFGFGMLFGFIYYVKRGL